MTLVRSCWVDCDGADCDAQEPSDLMAMTPTEAHAIAAAHDWVTTIVNRSRRHLCPNCADERASDPDNFEWKRDVKATP